MTHIAREPESQEAAKAAPAPAQPSRAPVGGETDQAVPELLVLQQSAGNRMVNRMVDGPAAPQGRVLARQGPAAEVDYHQLADDYEGDAMSYFEQNMRMELEAAAGTEGAAIGRRAGVTAAAEVRKVCEPYEEDQENDTNVLNTIFAITGGGLTISEGKSSGTTAGGSGQANIASRAVRSAMTLVNVWLPTLAGYKTVGQLKSAASRQAEETGAAGGETSSSTFGDYQTEALKALHADFTNEVLDQKNKIIRDKIDATGVSLAKGLFATWRSKYMEKLRKEYGASSPVGTEVQEAIVSAMKPKMAQLKKALDAAKEKRQTTQQTTGILGGVIGGAVTGAAIGGALTSWSGPGMIIGGAIGGILGGIIGGVGAAIMGD